jgi:IMP dehydrogenase
MKIKDLMRQAFVIDKDISLSDAAEIMSDKEVGSLIYIQNGDISGIVTERDLLRNFDSKKKVSQVMTKEVITIGLDTRAEEALDLMRDNKIKRLPVVDSSGKLIGIVTLTDLATHFEEIGEDFFFDD